MPESRVEDVVDLDSFRRVASALLCDRGLRCGDTFGELQCHPSWAAYAASRCNAFISLCGPDRFDVVSARACVEALAHVELCDTAYSVACLTQWTCHNTN